MQILCGAVVKDKYKIIRLLGEGGMAQVWLAEEITFRNRQVAIKVPLPGLSPEESHILQARFKREVDVCAELAKAKTPHIVQALTAEPYEDGNILVLEYMPGGDLATRIQQNPNGMPIETVIKIAREILTALDAIHNHPLSIVHRDVKPSNILFNAKDEACLGDFGLAQMGRASGTLTSLLGNQSMVFTLLYCAPELIALGSVVMPSTDIYSFGCVLFEILTGKLYKQVKPGTPPSKLRTDVPSWLDELVIRSTMQDQWERWQSVSEMMGIILEHKDDLSAHSPIQVDKPHLSDKSQHNHLNEKASTKDSPTAAVITSSPKEFINDRRLTIIGKPEGSDQEWEELKEEGGVIQLPDRWEFGVRKECSSDQELDTLVTTLLDLDSITIKALDISRSVITSAGLSHLEELKQLDTLDVSLCKNITDAGLAHLKRLKKLTHLNLSHIKNITDTGLAHLEGFTQLSSLSLAYCRNIIDDGLAHLKKLRQLHSLNISNCKKITDTGMVHFKFLNQLTELNLSGCNNLSDAGLAQLKDLTQLTKLDLSGCEYISDAGLAHLKNLPQLSNLDLSHCGSVTDAGLMHLKRMTELSKLNLRNTNITDIGLEQLKDIPQLAALDLSFCNHISDTGLANLKGLIRLSRLHLRGTKMTDSGLAHLSGLTHLTEVNLSYCSHITDAGLAHLKRLTQLRSLDLSSCDSITDAGLVHFMENFNHVRIAIDNATRVRSEQLKQELARMQNEI